MESFYDSQKKSKIIQKILNQASLHDLILKKHFTRDGHAKCVWEPKKKYKYKYKNASHSPKKLILKFLSWRSGHGMGSLNRTLACHRCWASLEKKCDSDQEKREDVQAR